MSSNYLLGIEQKLDLIKGVVVVRKLSIRSVLLSAAFILSSCGGGGNAAAIYGPRCSENISNCFKGVQIAKYKDNKQAAASYTFDDGTASSFKIADIFEKFDLRVSFYIVPGFVNAHPQDWSLWRGLVEKGHEIGNHSMNHIRLSDMALSDEELDRQINGAQLQIEEKTGIRPLVFAFPYDAYNDRSIKIVNANHVATRTPGFTGDPTYQVIGFVSSLSVDKVNAKLTDTIKTGGWLVAAGHGIDGNGFSPVTSQFLHDHLDFARSLSSQLWVDTFLNVARYRLCRDQVSPEIAILSSTRAALRLAGNFSRSICTAPLTVAILTEDIPSGRLRAFTSSGQEMLGTESMGMFLLNIRPGEEVNLQII